jgi:transcription initiation factor TFIID subunit TAF12
LKSADYSGDIQRIPDKRLKTKATATATQTRTQTQTQTQTPNALRNKGEEKYVWNGMGRESGVAGGGGMQHTQLCVMSSKRVSFATASQ